MFLILELKLCLSDIYFLGPHKLVHLSTYLTKIVLTSEINKIKLLLNKTKSLRNEKKSLLKKIKELEKEDSLSQQTIINLQSEVAELEENLQTTQLERDQLQQSLKRSLLGSLFKGRQKKKRINELNNSLSFLRGLLVGKNQQITNLTNERDDYQTK